MHRGRGDDLYVIPDRTKGPGEEKLTAEIRTVFGIENMHDAVFTAPSENNVRFLKDHELKV